MSAVALADFLTDFGTRARQPAAARQIAEPVERPAAAPTPVPDVAAIVAEAVEKAECELTLALRREHDAQLAEVEVRHAEAISALEARLGAEMGRTVAAALAKMEARLFETTGAVAARILGQFASDAMARGAVEQLAHAIGEAVGDAETIRIRVRGPQSMMMPLTATLGDLARHVEFVEQPGLDLRVEVNETLFETRLSEWASSLSEILQ